MEEMAQIFAGAAIFGAKQELKRQGTKLGKKVARSTVESSIEGVKVARARTSKAQRKASKAMSKALKEANSRYRNKNGSLKKGRTQADIMKLAQRLRRKMK